jgi:hypothetical protein
MPTPTAADVELARRAGTGRRVRRGSLGALAALLLAAAPAQAGEYLRLKVLVVVYADTFAHLARPEEVANAWREADEAAESFWRASGSRLGLALDRLQIDRHLSRDQFEERTRDQYWLPQTAVDGERSVEGDLVARGYQDAYDVVVVFYAWENAPGQLSRFGAAASGVTSLLGRAAYIGIPMAWKPEQLNRYFEHEFLHVLASIFEATGYTDFPEVHNEDFFRTIYGDEVSWSAWVLDGISDRQFFAPAGRWGTVEALPDGSPRPGSFKDPCPVANTLCPAPSSASSSRLSKRAAIRSG